MSDHLHENCQALLGTLSEYIDVSSFSAGNYYLTVKNKNGSLTKKLCIQN